PPFFGGYHLALLSAATSAATSWWGFESAILCDRGVGLELQGDAAEFFGSLGRIATHTGFLTVVKAIRNTVLANVFGLHIEHLRRVLNSGVTSNGLCIPAELGEQPGFKILVTLFIVIGQPVNFGIRSFPFFCKLVGNILEAVLIAAIVADQENLFESTRF